MGAASGMDRTPPREAGGNQEPALCVASDGLPQLRSVVRLTGRCLRSKSSANKKSVASSGWRKPQVGGSSDPNTARWAEAGGWRGGVSAGRRAESSTGDQGLAQAEKRFGWKRTGALTCVAIRSGRERRISSLVSDKMAPGGCATAARQSSSGSARRLSCVRDARGSQPGSGARRR
jgi:hypothetical protein